MSRCVQLFRCIGIPDHALKAGLCLAAVLTWAATSDGETPAVAEQGHPSYMLEVMPVISKAGCNAGACHGNATGKGGLQLSLRGQDADIDHATLTRAFDARRVDPIDPDESLILLKATSQVAHQGGVRFRNDSTEYRILRDWIAAGAPGLDPEEPTVERLEVTPLESVVVAPEDTVPITAVAHLSDGTQRDVTSLATYEPSNLRVDISPDGVVQRLDDGEATVIVRFNEHQVPVRVAFIPDRPDYQWPSPPENNYIDQLVFEKLEQLQIIPSALSSDTQFVRRAYLDALGVLPTAEEARRFVQSSEPDKRARLIDQLLARPEFAEHWALKWSDMLRNEEKVLDAKGVEVFHDWIRDSIAQDKPVDEFVRRLVSASGSTYDNPPANYYRANRDPSTRAETTARLFMGVRLQCAKCHNHPFDTWRQDDYYDWASVFARIDYEIPENERRDRLDNNEFIGEQFVEFVEEGEVTNPRTGEYATPRLLGGPVLDEQDGTQRLTQLAEWLTRADNELFVQSQANFVWYHLMGRGLVEPLDDFRHTNPAVNPALLDALVEEFVSSGFRLRPLVRSIMNSRVYQLTSEPNETNESDEENFSRAVVRRLTAEQLLDAQTYVIGLPAEFNGYPLGTRAGQVAGVERVRARDERPAFGDRFLRSFGKPERLLACECERSDETTLNHAFLFISDEHVQQRLQDSSNRLPQLEETLSDDDELVTELYWTALSRPPGSEERRAMVEYLSASDDRLAALQDIAWALMNAKEFIFRH